MADTRQQQETGKSLHSVDPAPRLPVISTQERERLLLRERAVLLDFEDNGTLSDAQAVRLRHIESQLDELEAQDPVTQEADQRLAQTSKELDDILAYLQSLPRKKSAAENDMAAAE